MIEFISTHIEGFASIRKETFYWNKLGLNIIQAPNGYGKTKFINALVWGLYGKTLSGSVEMWAHLWDSSYQGVKVCNVLMVNDIPIKITRYKDYTKMKNALILEIDGDDPEDLDKGDTQKEIEKYLGYTYELFKNSIIFGQKLKRIISETGPNKKKVFDDAFEVAYILKAKKFAEEKRRDIIVDEHKAELVFIEVSGLVTTKQSEIAAQKTLVENFEGDKKKELQEVKIKVRKKRVDHGELLKVFADVDEQLWENNHELEIWEKDIVSDKEYLKMEKDLTKFELKKENEEEDRDKINEKIKITKLSIENVPELCEYCGKSYTKNEKLFEVERLKVVLITHKKEYKEHKDTIGNIGGQIKELNEDISSALNIQEAYNTTTSTISKLEKQKNELDISEKELESLIKEKHKVREKKLENNIPELEIELTDLESDTKIKKRELRKIRRDLDTYEWVIKDPLSNAGIKAFIFNLMLDDVNDRLEFYSKYTGFQVAFFIDMKSANKNLETYVFMGKEPVPYDDLSGGQQQTADIAAAFSIHDVVSDSKLCNLLVMDEVFESLDKDNIEIITEIIQDKAQDKCLYLVTHRAEFNPTNANIINLDFTDGITSLV